MTLKKDIINIFRKNNIINSIMFSFLHQFVLLQVIYFLLYTFRYDIFKKLLVYSYINVVKFKIITESYYLDFKQKYLTNSLENKENQEVQERNENCYLLIYVNKDNTCDEQVFSENELFQEKQEDPLTFIYKESDRIKNDDTYVDFLSFYCIHIDDKLYYYRIDESTSEEELENIKICEIPFIEIDLLQNNQEISLKKRLELFYLKKNKILDYSFLVWFLDRFCKMTLDEKYVIKIIDKEVNMFEIKNSETQVCNSIIL